MYWANSGEMLFAVQPWLDPPPPTDNMLIEIPQTFAATLIGICALIGMFDLSIFRSSARSLRTLRRSTLTSDVPRAGYVLDSVGDGASRALHSVGHVVRLTGRQQRERGQRHT